MASSYMPSHRSIHLTNEIYRTVKQNFILPDLPGYNPTRVWKRKGCELVVERPNNYWKTHFIRRKNNANRGFYSTTSEPYKCMGGDVVLDTYNLVYDNLNCIDKVNVAESRKEAEVKHEIYNPIIKTDGEGETEDNNRRGSGRAGYCAILDSLKTTGERMAAVRAGLPYEEHLRTVEAGLADLCVKPVESMVLISTSDLILQNAMNRDAIAMASPDNRSIITETINNEGSRSTLRIKSANTNSRASTASYKTLETVSEKGSNSSFFYSTVTEKLDRLRRDNVDYLKCILEVIIILHNMKSKFLKSKVPLPPTIMRSLRNPDGISQKSKASKFSKYNSKRQSTETLISNEHSNFMLSDLKGSLDSPSGFPRRVMMTPATFGVFSGRRYSRIANPEEIKMETWEDIVNLDNRDRLTNNQLDAATHLHITTDMASRTIKWSKATKDSSIDEKLKSPLWQIILMERTSGESFQEKKSNKGLDVAMVPQRSRKEWEQVKTKLQKNCISDVEQLGRQTLQYYRFKLNSFDKLKSKSLFEKHCNRMRDTSGLIPVCAANNEIMEALEIPPSKWFEELQIKIFNVMGPDEHEINNALRKLARYSQMGVKSVPHSRAKLCLVVMSMPAYDICKIPMQFAIKFVLENILNGQGVEFFHWLHLRKLPLVLVK